jgi:hypothetical protein
MPTKKTPGKTKSAPPARLDSRRDAGKPSPPPEEPTPRYTPQVAEQLVRKLQKRGFITDGIREHCRKCGLSAVTIYRLVGRIGGRDIFWCQYCHDITSFRRASSDTLTEEQNFDLEAFLK